MKKLLIILICIATATNLAFSAPPEKEIKLGAEFVSRYMWRGYCLGGAGFQSSVGGELFGNDSHALELEAWGYTDFDFSTKEIDLSLSYYFFQRKVAITLYDYWYVPDVDQNFLDYKKNSTLHTLEFQFDYICNLKNDNNLIFKWATIFYGNDKNITSGYKLKQAYSSYFEIKYEGVFLSPKYGCEASLGFSPWKSSMFYEVDKFSCINAELKIYRSFNLLDDVELTPSVAFAINPALKDAYLSFGVALSF